MKKQYFAPEQKVVAFQTEGMLASSTVRISNQVTNDDAVMSNSREEGLNHSCE